MISAVFQEIRPTAREDAIAAMKAAGIWAKIESLENSIDTHLMKGIYDDGVDLSGGEMQKLVLARAIYKFGIKRSEHWRKVGDMMLQENRLGRGTSCFQGKRAISQVISGIL